MLYNKEMQIKFLFSSVVFIKLGGLSIKCGFGGHGPGFGGFGGFDGFGEFGFRKLIGLKFFKIYLYIKQIQRIM